MARRTPQTQAKRQREAAKREKRLAKDARRELRKAQKLNGPEDSVDTAGDVDSENADSGSSDTGPLPGEEI